MFLFLLNLLAQEDAAPNVTSVMDAPTTSTSVGSSNWWGSCLQNATDNTGKIIAKDVATLNCVPKLFEIVLNFAFGFAGIVAILLVMYSGIKFLLAGGDEKGVEEARKTLTYAIIGLVVVLLSFTIINFISKITGAGCILTFGLSTTICQ